MNGSTRITHKGAARALTGIVLVFAGTHATAQLTVSPQSNLQQLAAGITGPGVSISNPVITCHAQGYGEFTYSGAQFGPVDQGVILTSGRITDAPGPNTAGNTTFQAGTPGDPLLNNVTGRTTYDACKFEFDIIPYGDTLKFDFVFASEEYNEWVGSQYNDVFGFFISGPGIAGDPGAGSEHNIALVPNTATPVTINNVNAGSNPSYYFYNAGGADVAYDGFTQNLNAKSPVQACQTYHLKLVLADASDRKFDSGVFIDRVQSDPVSMSTLTFSGGPDLIEACNNGWVRFQRALATPLPLTLQYYLQGTATNGTDYTAIGNINPLVPHFITIPANQTDVLLAVDPLFDVAPEGTETIEVVLGNPLCPGSYLDTIEFNIIDSLFAPVSAGGTICAGGSWPFTSTGGTSYSWSPAVGLSCATCPNPVASPTTTTNYTVTITDANCSRIVNRLVRVSDLTLSSTVTQPLCNGGTNGAINLTVSNGVAPYTYSWTGPGGFTSSSQDITNLAPGTYGVTVSDAACTRSASFNVIAPAVLGVTLAPSILPFGQNISCFGGNDGAIDATITGGTGPYTVIWTGPSGYTSSSVDINGLYAGAYAINVTDNNGCTAGANATLIQATQVIASITSVTAVDCFNANNGSATATASGGIPPYSYAWNSTPAQNTSTATGLAPGSYTVTVTDGYNCTATTTANIGGPTVALTTNLTSQVHVLCFGNSTGSASISISGGTPPYSTTWNTTPAQNGTSAINLPAGTWTATVIDANGCIVTRNVTITQPASPLAGSLFAQTNVPCFGNTTGSATAMASGGTGPYTYSWNTSPAQTSATATGLSAGGYTCTITDVNLCSATVNVTITQPAAALSASISAQTNVLCNGNSTGSATASAGNGTGPYSYSWNTSPVQTTATASGLAAGSYACTVTDANGCTTTASVVITQPAAALSASIGSQTNVDCFGNSTGSATVNIAGGTAPYSSSWNTTPVQTGATATGLAAGSHTCTITDANGCTTVAIVTISQPVAALSASVGAQTDVSCHGNSTGSATVNASGGSAPYTWSWNSFPIQSTATATGLAAGGYTCAITDANGCSTLVAVTVSQPVAALSGMISSQTNVLIFGQSTGSATITASDGTPPYTYLWSNGQTTATASGLAAGTYTVTVTDANGCTTTISATITQPGSALTATIGAQTNVACFGESTGSATADASGGNAPYAYAWNTTPVQTGQVATGLAAGAWTCTVTDGNGAVTTVAVVITQPAAPLAFTAGPLTNVDCFGSASGSATVIASGGTPPHAYVWNTTPVQNGAIATDLAAGSYACTITDASGCTTTQSVTITQPAAALIASIGSQTNVDCFGSSSGSATASAANGTAPYAYSWNTSPVQSSATATGLFAGTWTCTVTDANGCITSVDATIGQPSAGLGVSIGGIAQATCGLSNGGATASATGGTGPYSYSWNSFPVQASASLGGVGAGSYTVIATDANGCTASAMVNITSPSGLSISVVGTTAQTCFGTANGQATVLASGGNAPYSYSWNTVPVQNDATASSLTAGTYTATVTDGDGCTADVIVTIDGPASPLTINVVEVVDVLCYDDDSGEATVDAAGGQAPYSYVWNTTPPQSGTSATGLSAGSYTVTATDALGCSTSINVTVTQPVVGVWAFVESFQDVSCFGAADGWATLEVGGGSGAWTIEWNTTPPQYGITATGLAPGLYLVTVTDDNGCDTPKQFPVVIDGPVAPLATDASTTLYNGAAVSCPGANDGGIDVTITGGSPNYSTVWTGPNGFSAANEDIFSLEEGTYDLLVTDYNGCTATASIDLDAPLPMSATAGITTAACSGASNGAVDVGVSNGIAPYAYAWSGPGGFAANTEDISGIPAGVYTVSVTDANGCTAAFSFDVNEPGLFSINATIGSYAGGSNVSCAGGSDGAIDVSVNGGTSPYTYQWSGPGGFTSNDQDISGLSAGPYDLTLIDANGCSTLAQYTLIAPAILTTTLIASTYPGGGNISCNGASDGAIDAQITGGTPGFVFAWTGPGGFNATTEDLGGLAPGTYFLTVWDVNGCSTTASTTLAAPAGMSVSVSTSQYNSGDAVACNGGSNGSIDLAIVGGLPPFGVQWTGPGGYTSSTEDIGALMAGTYAATITDAAGCDATVSVTLTEPAPVNASGTSPLINGYEVGCNGGSNGSIDLTTTGGAGNYTWQWTGPNAFVSTSEDIIGLEAGIYDVTVTDMNGCGAATVFTLAAPPAIATAAAVTPASCNGNNDGAIDLTASGGVVPFAFAWTGPGGYNAATEDLTNLFSGIYDVVITDANGCTHTQSFEVNQPGNISVSANVLAHPGGYGVSCSYASDGAIDVTTTGGTPPYYYAWSGPGGFSSIYGDISGVAPGPYDLTVTDANGCVELFSYVVTAPTPINIGLIASQFFGGANVGCVGGADGSIDAIVQGGVAPYSIAWSGPNGFISISEDITGLAAGTYAINVTDAVGCTASDGVTMTEPDPIDIDLSAAIYPGGGNVSCDGENDGSIDMTLSGGALLYNIFWTGPNGFASNDEDLSGLEAGTYNVTVTDANACPYGASITLNGPVPIGVVLVPSQYSGGYAIDCHGGLSGTVDAIVSGGSIPWTFLWTGPGGFTSTSEDLASVGAGAYALTVTDAAGCTATATVILEEPTPLDVSAVVSDAGNGYEVGCAGNDGAIDVTVTGGNAPYIFDWTGTGGFASLSEDLTGLGAGTYTLVVTDVNGCSSSTSHALDQATDLAIALAVSGNVCDGLDDGAIDLTVSGGVPPLVINWTGPGGFTSTSEDLSALSAGDYVVTVTDAGGCGTQSTATIAASAPFSLSTFVSYYNGLNIACAGDSSGVIGVTIAGGTAPIDFSWSGPGGFASSDTYLTGLVEGGYTIAITDINGCAFDTTITLAGPAIPLAGTLDALLFPSGTNVSCFGASDGAIDLTPIGGAAPYAFDWRAPDSTASYTEDIANAAAGTWDLVITDANMCAWSTSITLTQPAAPISATAMLSDFNGWNTSCDNSYDGSIVLDAMGGSGGLTYAWSGPGGFASNASVLDSLFAGSYGVTITDVNGCTLTLPVEVTGPQALLPVIEPFVYGGAVNVSCAGASDGSMSVVILGGTPDHTLLWTGPGGFASNNASINGLVAGSYCLEVTDANGCYVEQCLDLIAPPAMALDATSSNASCGSDDASIDLTISGGIGPHLIEWTTGDPTEDIGGLGAGTYAVTVTDANGCQQYLAVEVNGTPGLEAEAVVSDLVCGGAEDGSIDLSVLNGTAPYGFVWSNGANDEDLTDLAPGSYAVEVTDANGCSWSNSFTVNEGATITIDSLVQEYANGFNVSSGQASDGMISVTPAGGTAPYSYDWSNGATSEQVNGLAAGIYSVTITDANGCSLTVSFTLDGPNDLQMPTGFSPNSDGANDAYVVQGLDAFANNKLVVFNRWGNVVFEQLNYRNDWDGDNLEGEALPNGTYFVVLRVNPGGSTENEEITMQNYVDLRR